MENIYYIGDLVFAKTPMAMIGMVYLFGGAKKTDSGWIVAFTTLASPGGAAGGSSTIEFEVNVGDTLRLGSGCKASVRNPVRPDKAYVNKKADKLYFDKIEKDLIELSFDLV